MLGVLRTTCLVVGAFALYCLLMAALWSGALRAGRRRARIHAQRRTAARAIPTIPATSRAELGDAGGPAGREQWARCWDQPPSWLRRDRPWAAAVVLLGAPSVRERTAPFVDLPKRLIEWGTLLEESRAWPADQRLLVQSAYELAFDPPGEVGRAAYDPVTLRDLVRQLDEDEVEQIRVAMQIRCGRLEPEDGTAALS